MPDVFDEIDTKQEGDIFDEIAPAHESFGQTAYRALFSPGLPNPMLIPQREIANTVGSVLNKAGDLAAGFAGDVIDVAGPELARITGGQNGPFGGLQFDSGSGGPVVGGLKEAARMVPQVAASIGLGSMGIPPPLAFAIPPAASTFEKTGDLGETAKAAAVGAIIPAAGGAARQATASVLAAGREIGIGPATRLGQKAVEAVGEQVGVQAVLEASNLPQYAGMTKEQIKHALTQDIIANSAFGLMSVPHVLGKGPSATETILTAKTAAVGGSILKFTNADGTEGSTAVPNGASLESAMRLVEAQGGKDVSVVTVNPEAGSLAPASVAAANETAATKAQADTDAAMAKDEADRVKAEEAAAPKADEELDSITTPELKLDEVATETPNETTPQAVTETADNSGALQPPEGGAVTPDAGSESTATGVQVGSEPGVGQGDARRLVPASGNISEVQGASPEAGGGEPGTAVGEATTGEPLTPASPENPFDTSATSSALTEVQSRKPRPLNKLYGPNPTTEQVASHKDAMREWNRENRNVRKEHKETVAKSNDWIATLDRLIEENKRGAGSSDIVGAIGEFAMDKILRAVRAAVRGGMALHDAITKAIAEHRAENKDAKFDDAELHAYLTAKASEPPDTIGLRVGTADEPLTTKRGDVRDTVAERMGLTAETAADSQQTAKDIFAAAGVQVTQEPGERLFRPTTDFEQELEGRKLLALAKQAIRDAQVGGNSPRVTDLADSLRQHFADSEAFSPELRTELGIVGQSLASERGRALGSHALNAKELGGIARNIRGALAREMYSVFNGETVERIMDRIITRFRNLFTDDEVADISAKDPRMAEVVRKLNLMTLKDDGGRVYREAQRRLKPKTARTPAEKEKLAREDEAIDQIIENAKKLGVKEPEAKPNQKLTPDERLGLMTRPETQAKIQEATEEAVTEAEFNAGWKAAEKRATTPEESQRIAEARAAGETPDAADVEAGLQLPEYAHWKRIRDGFLDYSPTTLKLVQDVIRGRFKGTAFEGDKTKPPTVPKIDLNKLAKEPDAEVNRVVAGQLAAVEEVMDLNRATAATKARVLEMIVRNVASQVQTARARVVEGFLNQKERPVPPTASAKLKGLINAGITSDPRYRSQPVRDLLKRVTDTFVKAKEFTDQATKTRAEKLAFLQGKFADIVTGEKLTDDWMKAAVWTHLAEKMQEAETAVSNRMTKAKDVSFDPNVPKTDAERSADRKASLDRLTGGIRAGMIDQRLVEDIALKPVLQKLVPSMRQIVDQVLTTPASGQAGLANAFSKSVQSQLSIDPALADKAGKILATGFQAKFVAARKAAVAYALEKLSPDERAEAGPGTPTWKRIEALVNAGGMDSSAVLKELAAKRDWPDPSPAEIERIKFLANEEQRLRTLTDADNSKGMTVGEKEYATLGDRSKLITEMNTRWARLTKPLTGANRLRALGEYVSSNLIFTLPFATRQTLDIATQSFLNTPTTAISEALANFTADKGAGRETRLWNDASSALGNGFKQQSKSFKLALSHAKEAAKGRSEKTVIADIQSGIMALERMNLRADELAKTNPVQSFVLRVGAITQLAFKFASAGDHFQGSLLEQQNMRAQSEFGFRQMGETPGEARRKANEIMGDIPAEFALAKATVADMPDIARKDKNAAAWNLVVRRQYQRMEMSRLPADDFEKINKWERELYGWNRPEKGGLGGAIGTGLGAIGKWGEGLGEGKLAPAGIPLIVASRFKNAIAIAINRSLTLAGGGFIPSAFKGSEFYSNAKELQKRKIEASIGLSLAGALTGLVVSRVLRVYNQWPQDKEERDLWQRDGHRPGTVEFSLGNGKSARVSMTVGPLSVVRPILAGIGAWQDAMDQQDKRNEKEAKIAGRKGVTHDPVHLDASQQLGIVGAAAYAAFLQGRTTSGIMGGAQSQGQFNLKKAAVSALAPAIPFQPMIRSLGQLAGADIDPKKANLLDLVTPMPWSGAERRNFLWDPVGNEGAVARVISILTGGTTIVGGQESEKAYRLIKETGWRPSSINDKQYLVFGNELRQMTPDELKTYSEVRAKTLKEELNGINEENRIEPQMKTALMRATLKAKGAIGARGGIPPEEQTEPEPAPTPAAPKSEPKPATPVPTASVAPQPASVEPPKTVVVLLPNQSGRVVSRSLSRDEALKRIEESQAQLQRIRDKVNR